MSGFPSLRRPSLVYVTLTGALLGLNYPKLQQLFGSWGVALSDGCVFLGRRLRSRTACVVARRCLRPISRPSFAVNSAAPTPAPLALKLDAIQSLWRRGAPCTTAPRSVRRVFAGTSPRHSNAGLPLSRHTIALVRPVCVWLQRGWQREHFGTLAALRWFAESATGCTGCASSVTSTADWSSLPILLTTAEFSLLLSWANLAAALSKDSAQ